MAHQSRSSLGSNTISISINNALNQLSKSIWLIVVLLFCGLAQGQQPDDPVASRQRGIQLYKKEELKPAIEALRRAVKLDKNDAEAWYYLGAALNRNDDLKGARKAFKRAIELRREYAPPHIGLAYVFLVENKIEDATREAHLALTLDAQNAEAHYVIARIHRRNGLLEKALEEIEIASALGPAYAPPYLLKSRTILELYAQESYINVADGTKPAPLSPEVEKSRKALRLKRFIEARDSLETYLQLSTTTLGLDVWREQLESLRVYVQNQERADVQPPVRSPSEVDSKPRIISKPSPNYPIKDRDAGITGTVTLFLTFAFDGTIKNVLVIQAPTDRLAASAVQAALKIVFIPAVSNGKPVSSYIRVEYNFNIY